MLPQMLRRLKETQMAMAIRQLLAGRTHTSRMMSGYCPGCGLYHYSPASRVSCERLQATTTPEDEMDAWRALKDEVAREQRR